MIPSYFHRCVVQTGDMAGNESKTEVHIYNMDNKCEYCGEELATLDDLVKHMYDELTGG